jgi:hypothetical protein
MKFGRLSWSLFGAALCLSGCQLLSPNAAMVQPRQLTLSPADFDRAGQVVSFNLPGGLAGNEWVLQPVGPDAGEMPLSIQADNNGRGTAFIPLQKASETLRFSIVPGPVMGRSGVAVDNENGRLRFSVDRQTVFDYQMAPAPAPRAGIDPKMLRGAFIHPIYSPAGHLVTDSYPADHVHHHGIWTAWEDTQFQGRTPDFWNTQNPNGGTVEFGSLDQSWGGPVYGGFVAEHRFMDRLTSPPTTALNERWNVAVYAAPGFAARIFDLTMTHTLATPDPLVLLPYRYGGLGVRGSAEWLDKSNFTVLTSNGDTDRVKAQGQGTRWFFMGGKVGGAPCGIAILDDPANFRAPQPIWMNADQPFFCYVPAAKAGFTISPEHPYVARYRFIVQDGLPDAKFIEACWQGFAHPASATVEAR